MKKLNKENICYLLKILFWMTFLFNLLRESYYYGFTNYTIVMIPLITLFLLLSIFENKINSIKNKYFNVGYIIFHIVAFIAFVSITIKYLESL